MSYSRWSKESNWYSFYNASNPDSTKDEQLLSLWHVNKTRDFTYKELKSFSENKLRTLYPLADADDISEALNIVVRFKSEVDADFAGDDFK